MIFNALFTLYNYLLLKINNILNSQPILMIFNLKYSLNKAFNLKKNI
jgi:hypothetical protein